MLPSVHSGGLSPSSFFARAFGVATAALLGFLLLRVLQPFAVPLLWATLLTFLAHPVSRRMQARLKRPTLTAALVTALVAFVVLGPVSLFGFTFVRQAGDLLSRFQAEAHDRKLPALQLLLELGPVQALLNQVGEATSFSEEQVLAGANQLAQDVLQELATRSGSFLIGAFSTVTKFGLTLFLLFFFVRDGREMLARSIRLVPMPSDRKDELMQNLGNVARGVVMGTLATSLVQGTLIGVGFAIAGVPSPLVFGAVGALASLVPVVGTTLVWVPVVISLVATGKVGWSIFLAIWCAGPVTLSDNIIRPLVASTAAKVSTLLVFVGVLGGISAFGFSGFFVGPVVLALVAALVRYADEVLGLKPASPPPVDPTSAIDPVGGEQPPPPS